MPSWLDRTSSKSPRAHASSPRAAASCWERSDSRSASIASHTGRYGVAARVLAQQGDVGVLRSPAEPGEHEPLDRVLLLAVLAVGAVERQRLLGQALGLDEAAGERRPRGLDDQQVPALIAAAGGARERPRAVQRRAGAPRDRPPGARRGPAADGRTAASRGRRPARRAGRPPRPRRPGSQRTRAASGSSPRTSAATAACARRRARVPSPPPRRSAPRGAPDRWRDAAARRAVRSPARAARPVRAERLEGAR